MLLLGAGLCAASVCYMAQTRARAHEAKGSKGYARVSSGVTRRCRRLDDDDDEGREEDDDGVDVTGLLTATHEHASRRRPPPSKKQSSSSGLRLKEGQLVMYQDPATGRELPATVLRACKGSYTVLVEGIAVEMAD